MQFHQKRLLHKIRRILFIICCPLSLFAEGMEQIAQPTADSSHNGTTDNVFTSGLFLQKGQYEFKSFHNLYTETSPFYANCDQRNTYLTSFFQLNIGSGKNINYGMDALYQSNTLNDLAEHSPFSVLNFERKTISQTACEQTLTTTSDHALSHLGAHGRIKPFRNGRFTLQQAVYMPLASIDRSWVLQSDLFFEYLAANRKIMLFGDLGIWYPTGRAPFPYLKFFSGTLIAQCAGPYIMLNLPYETGAGLKIFLLPKVELEFLYTRWLPLEWVVQNRKPQSFNIGLRFSNFKSISP